MSTPNPKRMRSRLKQAMTWLGIVMLMAAIVGWYAALSIYAGAV